jgi:hypothetical protein
MYSLNQFTISDMIECGAALRKLGTSEDTMEAVADKIARFFYSHFHDPRNQESALALARFFKTHDYGKLPTDLQHIVRQTLNQDSIPDNLKCLTLLGTAGDRPEWNSRTSSISHQVIPLPSKQMLSQVPMMSQLIQQLGLTIESVVSPDPEMIVDMEERTYNVFYVPNAQGSPYIPDQEEFVMPLDVQSVLGFGGILPSGNLMIVILFSKVLIERETAELFRPLALNTKMPILPFDQGAVFS